MLRSSVPKKAGTHQRSNSQRGLNSFTEDYEQENFELANKGFRNTNIIGRSDNTRGGFVPKGSAAAKFHEKKNHKGKEGDDENELSSLSGFTASDNEEHEDDMKFKVYPNKKKNVRQYSDDDEENLEEEHHDIVLNPKDDLKARFAQLEMIKKKNEEERKRREILGERDLNEEEEEEETDAPVPLKRPQSSYGRGGSENVNKMNATTGFMPRQKENVRPQTANVSNMRIQYEEESERPNVTFKPIYTKSINQTLIEKKVFNYTDKKFKTIPKKSDPVSRFNAFRNGWNKTKFLKNTGGNDNKKEGRKLNLSERNQTSKPDFIFHKYQPKYVFDV